MYYENKKLVIWTEKVFVAWEYPHNDVGENYTRFYRNLRDRSFFCECLARLSEEEKKEFVADKIGIASNLLLLKSKKSHSKKSHFKKLSATLKAK